MYNKRSIGREFEQKAVEYLILQGYKIIITNFQCRTGEIDIIAEQDNYLIFIEVKYRTNSAKGMPHEAVDIRKIKKISKTARYYMFTNNISMETPCRFDVVLILNQEISLIQDAFQAIF
ncbi:YraN family protein [Anaerocolumna aminovalerica]|uniref:YraN family protein n=1 Tax=Anaerocolumna aminovalerica TaxID=1527 RepID=UPI001C0EA012|nr:YraN family protein [Anaerocolumna aminovalerica]MBU5334204.1 YraN family protein [Anaerocolumna aminovalerica]